MKEISINIAAFLEKFNQEYDFLYDNFDRVAGYDEAVTAFDEFSQGGEANAKFIGDFVKYRGDFVSSDREAAAFMFALGSMVA